MEQGFDLKAFLDAQVAEGRVDSEDATFTVAREKALTKIAHFALPDEYDWVLKIVQAVNLWEAPILSIRQSRVATTFYFCPPSDRDFPSESNIVSALDSTALDGDRPVHQLAMALRALVQQCHLSFVLAVRRHGQLGKPIHAGDDTSNLDSATRAEWTHLDKEGVRLTVSHFRGRESFRGRYVPTISFVARRGVEILRILERRCFTSPIPIEVDARRVTRIYPTGDFDLDRRSRPLFHGHLEMKTGKSATASVTLISGYQEKEPVVRPSEYVKAPWFIGLAPESFTLSNFYQRIEGLLSPIKKPQGHFHTFWWVRHGVVVAKFQSRSSQAVGVSYFFPAEHLRSDLSGLNVALDREFPAPIKATLLAVNKELKHLLESGGLVECFSRKTPEYLEAPETSEAVLRRAGYSVFTETIGFAVPSARRSLLRALDTASQLVGQRGNYEELVLDWVWHIWDQVQEVVTSQGKLKGNLVRRDL